MKRFVNMVLVQRRITCGLGFPQATQKPIIKQSNQQAYLVLYGEIGSKVGQCSQSSGSSTGQGLWRPTFHLYIAALFPLSALPSAFLPLLCPHRALQEPCTAQPSSALGSVWTQSATGKSQDSGYRGAPHSLQERALPSGGS